MLLLDIKTQRMDGLEVLRQIRHRDPGVEACVVKPVDVDRFFPAAQLPGRFRAVLDETPDGD
jgi:DNA-binding NarL/FixJ family response regulator